MKRFLLPLAAAAMCITMASCESSEDNGYTTVHTYNDGFYLVSNLTDGTTNVIDDVTIGVAFNYDYGNIKSSTATLVLRKVPTATTTIEQCQFENLPLLITDDGHQKIEVINVSPVENRNLVFKSIKLEWLDRRINLTGDPNKSTYVPVVQLSFVIDDNQVDLVSKYGYYFGTTTVTNRDNSVYTNKDILYVLTVDPKTMTSSLLLKGAQFAEKMPPMNMTFPGINFAAAPAVYSLSSEMLVPSIDDTPYPNFAITDLTGKATASGNMNVSFTVGAFGRVSAKLGPAPDVKTQQN